MKTTTGILSIALASGLLAACGGSDSNSTREQAMEDSAAAHGIDADVTLNDDGETEKVVINAAINDMDLLESISRPHVDKAIADDQVASFDKFDSHLLGEE